MELRDRIRTARKARDMSQEELARRTGVSLNAINRLERGVATDPHYSTLVGIAEALGMSVPDLLEEPVAAPLGEAGEGPATTEDAVGAGPQLAQPEGWGDEGRRVLFGSWAHFLTFKNEEWLEFLDELPEPPEPEEFERGLAVIQEMSSTFGAMMTGLSNYDVIDEVGRFAEAKYAGEPIPNAFDEEHGLLHGELEVWIYRVIPKARNWSTRFEERVELLGQLEERAEKWAQELKLQPR